MVFSREEVCIVSCLVSLLQKPEFVFVYFPGIQNSDVIHSNSDQTFTVKLYNKNLSFTFALLIPTVSTNATSPIWASPNFHSTNFSSVFHVTIFSAIAYLKTKQNSWFLYSLRWKILSTQLTKQKFFLDLCLFFFAGPPAVVRLPFHDIDINDTRFLCTWEYPKDNNGANITMFTVWYRPLLREKWSKVNVTQNRYPVRLNCCLTYEIMVTAWNKKGQSSFDPRTAARVTVLKGTLLTFDYFWLSNLIFKHILMCSCQYFAQKYYFTVFFFNFRSNCFPKE